jgi:N-acetylneuraminate synthase
MKANSLDQIKNIFLESNKTKIAVIGKGKSIHSLELSLIKEEYFVISLNDADDFIDSDLTIFYRKDLYQKFQSKSFPSKKYIAPLQYDIPQEKHIPTEYESFEQEGFEKIYTYFASNEFYILDFTLLSAIKLVILFQEVKNFAIDALFLGFDFHMKPNELTQGDFHGIEFRNALLRTQESLFITLTNHIQERYPKVNLIHVGNKKYSQINIDDFKSLFKKKSPAKVLKSNQELYKSLLEKIDTSNKVIVVAEFTNNHIGDKNRLIKMIELASQSGADIIKVQKRDVSTFYTEEELNSPYESPFGKTLKDYREGVELTPELFEILDIECRKRNVPWFASVLDWNSYLYLKQLDCPMIKLPSTISNHKNYLTSVANDFGGELVVSTGFTDKNYESFVLENLIKEKKLFLLQCTSSYPTPPEGCQISVVRYYEQLREKFPNIIPGYSSHDIGSLGCMMAVAAGARMVEKHVKLGNLEWVHFDGVAIDLYNNQFTNFVNDIRKAEIMCGSKEKFIHKFEHHKYRINEKAN